MKPAEQGLVQSVRQRLLNRSRETGADYSLLLTRYAVERLLYRLSRSEHVDAFVLKGAMLFAVWTGELYRPTRDIDLLGFGEPSEARLVAMFRDVCNQVVEDDGMAYDAGSVTTALIRDEDAYAGIRLRLIAKLGNARISLQVDVGFGDVVIPEARIESFPALLELPGPQIRVYSPESVVAEKMEAIVSLGIANSRMKDFHDIWVLLKQFELNDALLAAAIKATFDRRRTPMPKAEPLGLTDEFASDLNKQRQWAAFLRRSGLPEDRKLSTVVEMIRERLGRFIVGHAG